eukprot:4266110-Alexandrium_andersonii.AAC.1
MHHSCRTWHCHSGGRRAPDRSCRIIGPKTGSFDSCRMRVMGALVLVARETFAMLLPGSARPTSGGAFREDELHRRRALPHLMGASADADPAE